MATRSYHHGDLRRSLIDASLGLISEQGVSHLSLREVAKKAGVSHSACYRHFDSKEELLAAVSEQGFHQLRRCCEQAAAKGADPIARLRLAGEAYVGFALKHPGEFTVMFNLSFDREAHSTAVLAGKSAFEFVKELISQCPVRMDVTTAARIAWANVHGLATLALRGQLDLKRRCDIADMTETSIEVLLRGLLE